jgi:hypothetical protein
MREQDGTNPPSGIDLVDRAPGTAVLSAGSRTGRQCRNRSRSWLRVEMGNDLLRTGPRKFASAGDRANVRQAFESLVEAGLAVIDCDAELFPLLYLLSGEIFVLGDDWVMRVQ